MHPGPLRGAFVTEFDADFSDRPFMEGVVARLCEREMK